MARKLYGMYTPILKPIRVPVWVDSGHCICLGCGKLYDMPIQDTPDSCEQCCDYSNGTIVSMTCAVNLGMVEYGKRTMARKVFYYKSDRFTATCNEIGDSARTITLSTYNNEQTWSWCNRPHTLADEFRKIADFLDSQPKNE